MRFKFEGTDKIRTYSFIAHIVEHDGYGTLHQLVNPLQIEENQKVFFTHDMTTFKFNLIDNYILHDLKSNNYSLRNLVHMFNELEKKSCLSGNSAMFLAAIKDMTRNMEYEVGYREHKRELRKTRNYALESILKVKKGIIEPKNIVFSSYFDIEEIAILENMDEKANKVIATVFKDFLNECIIK